MRFKITFLLSFLFFFVGVLTLPHYGINWDTINHLPRGQVYLHYFLTGKKDFSDLTKSKPYWQNPKDLLPSLNIRSQKAPLRSYYENDAFNYNWYLEVDGAGHPPLSDILSSVFNRVLFGHLKIVNDIDSYRVYGVFLAASLVGLIYFWVSKVYGGFAGLISALSLATYPLFWAESHFNTEKDVPETAFWAFFLFCIWNGIIKKSWKWILASGVFFSLALGTKFNILFSVFVFLPWIFIYLRKKVFEKEYLMIFLFGILAFIFGAIIFYASWPFLWQDIIAGTQKVFGFYRAIGISSSIDQRFAGPFGFNTYPAFWISVTTPIPILILSFFGLLGVLLNFKKDKHKTGTLFLLWFLIPVFRVSLPGSNIYGGIRQIMEYIPGMVVVAGIGADFLIRKLRVKKFYTFLFLVVTSSFLIFNLYRIHPNENAYFNSLIGGLAGAKEKNLPSWGNTFGGAYRQAFTWVNGNAEEGSNLVFAHELMPNAPAIWVRPDIKFFNTARSGFLRRGEYATTLTYEGTSKISYYDGYLENFLDPVYESTVDGVAVVKVWKNDEKYVKDSYKKQESIEGIVWNKVKNGVLIDLRKEYHLSYLKLEYGSSSCDETPNGRVMTSIDASNWSTSSEPIPSGVVSVLGDQPQKGSLYFPFLADEARFIKIVIDSNQSCLNNTKRVSVYHFSNLDR